MACATLSHRCDPGGGQAKKPAQSTRHGFCYRGSTHSSNGFTTAFGTPTYWKVSPAVDSSRWVVIVPMAPVLMVSEQHRVRTRSSMCSLLRHEFTFNHHHDLVFAHPLQLNGKNFFGVNSTCTPKTER